MSTAVTIQMERGDGAVLKLFNSSLQIRFSGLSPLYALNAVYRSYLTKGKLFG